MRGFLDYVGGNSVLHKLNPMTKLVIAFALCASCFITGSHYAVIGVIALNLFLALTAGVFRRSLAMLAALIKLSVLLFVVQIFFVRDGNIILSFPFGIYITDTGLSFSSLFALRLTAATMPLAMMLSITKISDISNALVIYLRIPYKYTFVLTTAIRFIPLFADEMAGIVNAQMSRGVDFDTGNFFRKIGLILPLCAPLLITSVRKSESAAISAELRGFNLRERNNGYKRYSFGLSDAAAIICCISITSIAFII